MPTLIEAVTFHMAGHSSSHDRTRYRDAALVSEWEQRHALARFRAWLASAGLLAEGQEERWRQ